MKKIGTQRRVEIKIMAKENLGMALRDMLLYFIITPPSNIPIAAAGRFIVPTWDETYDRLEEQLPGTENSVVF